MADPGAAGGAGMLARRMSLVVDHLTKRFGTVVALDDLAFEVAAGPGLRLPGRERRGQDDDDADRPRRAGARRRAASPGGAPRAIAAARDLGLPARGARPLSADAGPRPARVLRGPPRRARGRARARGPCRGWRRFRAEDLADRRAEQLSKGNQQKVQFIAAVLHDPQVLLMDEPFTGLDPVNVMLLREAFLELRDRGRTVVFSTHQMEVAEALCESVAIVDRGRMVRRRADPRGPAGDRPAAWCGSRSTDDHRLPWLAAVPGARVIQAGVDRSIGGAGRGRRAGCGAGRRGRVPGHGSGTSRSRTRSLEQVFIDFVGRPADEEIAPRAGAARRRARRRGGRRRRRRPGRRGAPDRGGRRVSEAAGPRRATSGSSPAASTASASGPRAFLFSTLLLVGLAVVIALIPLGGARRRPGERDAGRRRGARRRRSATRTAQRRGGSSTRRPTATETAAAGVRARARCDGVDAAVEAGPRRGGRRRGHRRADARTAGLDFQVRHDRRPGPGPAAQLLQLGHVRRRGPRLDRGTSPRPTNAVRGADVRGRRCRRGGGRRGRRRPIDTAEYASRRIVGIVFVVLSFLTLVFYGLWVASGVVAEKASRVMELLISAATAPPAGARQDPGHRAGGADAGARSSSCPALIVMVASGRLGNALLGEDPTARPRLAGLSPGSVAAFLVYFMLGFALYAALYAGGGLAAEPRRGPPDRSPCRSRSRRSWATCPRCWRCPGARPGSSGSRRTCRCGARS